MSDDLHVVFGAGQVGGRLVDALLGAGHRVRLAKRTPAGVPAGAEVILGHAAEPEFCVEAARGASVVYHCMNPKYDRREWAILLPLFMDNLVAAAAKAGARLVVLDNLYMLGRPEGRPLDEDTPMRPCSVKGRIRAHVAGRLWDAHRRGDVLATSGRASDFYGPGGTLTHLGDRFWPNVLRGKPARVVVDTDAVHTYHYIPDVAAGLVALGSATEDAYGTAWMLPCRPAETLRDLATRLAAPLGHEVRLAKTPGWVLSLLSIGVPIVRELAEMQYQWSEPFVVDDRRFRERFGLDPTDADVAAASTVAWARDHYGSDVA